MTGETVKQRARVLVGDCDLRRGDCLRVMPLLPAGSVQMVLCDLPYGNTANAWDRPIPLAPLWRQYQRLLAPHGVVALFTMHPHCHGLYSTAPRGWCRYEWIWEKGAPTGAGFARYQPMRRHEAILMFYRETPQYNPPGLKPFHKICAPRPSEVYGGFRRASVQTATGWPQSILHYKREHRAAPAQKPVDLLEFLIRTYTTEWGLVLDNAMGLGSTGVAAVRAGRAFIGIEKDRRRFGLAKERIERAVKGAGR